VRGAAPRWNTIFGRSPRHALAFASAPPTDVVLVFKGAGLAPADVDELRRRSGGPLGQLFPDDPHQLELSRRLAPAYDCFFTHDSSSLARHRSTGARAHYLAFGCDPEYLRPPTLSVEARWTAPLVLWGLAMNCASLFCANSPMRASPWGPGWPRGPLYGDDFVRALAVPRSESTSISSSGSGRPARYGTGEHAGVRARRRGTPQLSDAKATSRATSHGPRRSCCTEVWSSWWTAPVPYLRTTRCAVVSPPRRGSERCGSIRAPPAGGAADDRSAIVAPVRRRPAPAAACQSRAPRGTFRRYSSAITRWEKLRSARARQARGSQSARRPRSATSSSRVVPNPPVSGRSAPAASRGVTR